jgi:hypothetical protein
MRIHHKRDGARRGGPAEALWKSGVDHGQAHPDGYRTVTRVSPWREPQGDRLRHAGVRRPEVALMTGARA